MEKKLTVAIVDRCPLFRSGLRSAFLKDSHSYSFEEVESIGMLAHVSAQQSCSVAFIDMEFYLDHKEAFGGVILPGGHTRFILLYDTAGKRQVKALFNDPFHGFVYKNSAPSEFIKALHQTMSESFYYCYETTRILSAYLHHPKTEPSTPTVAASFTEKEKDIIGLICEEYTAKEIADKLSLSKRTVENRKIKILEKMHVKNMAGIVAFAYKNNLLKKETAVM